ncbi:MAG: RNA-binding S4 domain-containing protein [Burkholderiaceae bacterium]|jgi:ribosome-associated heat shock protein Hsp15
MRLDKWLWAARFYKTRALAVDEITLGRVQVNGADAKPARELRPGDTLHLRQGWMQRTVIVRALSERRGPASEAQALYEETADSIAAREQAARQRREAPEPALARHAGRPTKRERRDLDAAQGQREDSGWGPRWSASID